MRNLARSTHLTTVLVDLGYAMETQGSAIVQQGLVAQIAAVQT